MPFIWIYMDGIRYDLIITYYENWVPKVKWDGWYGMGLKCIYMTKWELNPQFLVLS